MGRSFSRRELLVMSLVAALSIFTKPYVRLPFAFVQTTLGMPVGVFVGGLYMFWPILMGRLIPKPGSVLITCVLQSVLALVTGFTGLLGPAAVVSYWTPGLVIEALYLIQRRAWPTAARSSFVLMAAGALGNLAGALTNALLFFALRRQAAAVAAVASLLSGAGGGYLAALAGSRLVHSTHATSHETAKQAS